MKRLLYTILASAIALTAVAQKPSANSTMLFDAQQWDFGTIKEIDGAVAHTFKFKNSGKTPFVIEAISVSCGCTTPEYSRAPILPNQRGEVKITFDPALRPGKFVKEIYVVSNNRQNVNVLKVKGNVVAKPRSVEQEYPVELISGVRLSAQMSNFGYIGQGQTRSQVIGLANTSSRSVAVEVRPQEQSPYFSVSVPEKICAGCFADITFTYDLSQGKFWGYMTDRTYVYINGKRMEIPLSSSAIAIDNFAGVDKALSPKALLSAMSHNFGNVALDNKLTHRFTLTNDGASTLVVRSVKPSQGCTTTLAVGTQIEPDESMTFDVSLAAEHKGRVTGSVVIIFNDPQRAMRDVRVMANVE